MSEIARDRDEALLLGMQHYYGTPCAKAGHGNVRRASNKHCRDCGVDYDARRRANMTETQLEAERARKREAKRAGRWVGEDQDRKRERDRARRRQKRESPAALLRRRARELDSLATRLQRAHGAALEREAKRQRDIERLATAPQREAAARERLLKRDRAKAARRRAVKRGADSDVTDAVVLLIREAQGERCAHCGSPHHLHLDHIVPVSKGGRHTADNIQFLCAYHNISKRDRDEVEYRAANGIPAVTPWDGYAARALWYGLAAAA